VLERKFYLTVVFKIATKCLRLFNKSYMRVCF
jgi:hypothetical protein